MRTILGLILACLLAATAFAQDRNFPAALGTGLSPLNSSGPQPGFNYGGFPRGDGYGYSFDGYGYAAPYPNAPLVVNRVVLIQQPAVPVAPPTARQLPFS